MTESYPWLSTYPSNVNWHAALEPKPLFALLDDATTEWTTRPAVHFLGRRLTYAELHAASALLAGGLQRMGVKRGVKVGLCLPNCPQFIIAYYAILRCGGTVVNFSPLYVGKEIARQVTDSDTEIMITLSLNALYPKVAESLGTTCLKKNHRIGSAGFSAAAKSQGIFAAEEKRNCQDSAKLRSYSLE